MARPPDPAVAKGGRLTAEAFAQACQPWTDVSRETMDRLKAYEALLRQWQGTINLVAVSTLGDLWRRHMLDSAQLLPLIPGQANVLVDMGSGAGFPGLVLAALTHLQVHLVESDQRKATFLRQAARALDCASRVTVHAVRLESLTLGADADVITARALAPLTKLCEYALPLMKPGATCVYLKGKSVQDELTEADKQWTMRRIEHPSLSDPSGRVLVIDRLARR